MYELALFAGAGGGILGGKILGWQTVGAVEIEAYPRNVLEVRQDDGTIPPFPIFEDIREFRADNRETKYFFEYLREISPDLVVSGGFPCQDISAAGTREGITGKRSGLWGEMARVIGEIRPRYAFVENSPMLVRRGLTTVLGDFASMGYDAKWCVLGADDVGAPHERKRIWILAHTDEYGCVKDAVRKPGTAGQTRFASDIQEKRSDKLAWWKIDPAELPHADLLGCYWWKSFQKRQQSCKRWSALSHLVKLDSIYVPYTNGARLQRPTQKRLGRISEKVTKIKWSSFDRTFAETRRVWPAESRLGRVAHGVANRVDRCVSIGNGQVPAVAALAWVTLGGPVDI